MQFPYQKPLPHYYGDMTRLLFIVIGVVMLLGLPKMIELLMIPVGYPIAAIAVVAVAAGFTNPKQYGSLILNVLVSMIGLASFIYVSWFMRVQSLDSIFLFINQILAVLFLLALYFSVKSLRGYSGN